MNARGPPRGYRLLAALSLVIGLGGLVLGVSAGSVGSLLLALVHLPAAYGLWTGAAWGGLVGVIAYGPVGGVITVLRARGDVVELALALLLAGVAVGYVYAREPPGESLLHRLVRRRR